MADVGAGRRSGMRHVNGDADAGRRGAGTPSELDDAVRRRRRGADRGRRRGAALDPAPRRARPPAGRSPRGYPAQARPAEAAAPRPRRARQGADRRGRGVRARGDPGAAGTRRHRGPRTSPTTSASELSRPWVGRGPPGVGPRLRRTSTTRSTGRSARPTSGHGAGRRCWWRAVRGLQWLLIVAALAGAVWLRVLAVLGYLQVSHAGDPPSPAGCRCRRCCCSVAWRSASCSGWCAGRVVRLSARRGRGRPTSGSATPSTRSPNGWSWSRCRRRSRPTARRGRRSRPRCAAEPGPAAGPTAG